MPRKLLLADDSITIQKVVAIALAAEDFAITAVDNGEDAIARARDLRPDIILADVVMPRKSGYEVCEAIKGDAGLKHIPVLLLAGTFEAFDEGRARAASADGHIQKPFESQALIDKVNGLLGKPAAKPAPSPMAMPAMGPTPGVGAPRPLGPAPVPPPARPLGVAPAAPRPPGSVLPGARPPAPPPGARPPVPGAVVARPGVPPPPGAARPGIPPPPGAPRPAVPGVAPVRPPVPGPPMAAARPIPPPPGVGVPRPAGPVPPAARPAVPGVPAPRPPVPGVPAAARPPMPVPGPVPPKPQRDPFGLGLTIPAGPAAAQVHAAPFMPPPARIEVALPSAPDKFDPLTEDVTMGDFGDPLIGESIVEKPAFAMPQAKLAPAAVPAPPRPVAKPVPAAVDGGEALLREALSKASREVIERIAWEVVPQLAETIIREELERLIKDREAKA